MNRWPQNKAQFWETAPFFRILLPMVAGITCAYYWSTAFAIDTLLIVITASIILYTVLALQKVSSNPNIDSRFIFLNTTL
ncbi:MAG: hypothetical protein ACTHJ0_01265 [Flavipsychrobacter sp.]